MTQDLPLHDKTAVRFLGRSPVMSSQLWHELEIRHPGDPKAQLRTWIDQTTENIRTGAGDLAMSGGDVEEDAAVRNVYQEAMVELCRRAGLSEPDIAAELLILMCEGAKATRQYDDSEDAGDRFRRAAQATVARLSPRQHRLARGAQRIAPARRAEGNRRSPPE